MKDGLDVKDHGLESDRLAFEMRPVSKLRVEQSLQSPSPDNSFEYRYIHIYISAHLESATFRTQTVKSQLLLETQLRRSETRERQNRPVLTEMLK